MQKTALFWHERMMWHDTGVLFGPANDLEWFEPFPHLENVAGKRRVKNLLDASGLSAELAVLTPEPVSDEQILSVHTEAHLQKLVNLSALSRGGEGCDAYTTTQVPRGGLDIFRLSAGAAVGAVDAVLSGQHPNAYALSRPPGHHAERNRVMGFCYLANGAIAARHAQQQAGIERVAFVDIDVHHGNGTEDCFKRDASVLTISIHQDRHFPPDTGAVVSAADGHHNNINIPLPPASGTAVYQAAFDQVVLPALTRFNPDLLIVPCGYDGSGHDPLGRMLLNSEDYRSMMSQLKNAAAELCNGRLVVLHEGGYAPHLVPFLAHAAIESLSGQTTAVKDPFLRALTSPWAAEIFPHQQAMLDAAENSLELLET